MTSIHGIRAFLPMLVIAALVTLFTTSKVAYSEPAFESGMTMRADNDRAGPVSTTMATDSVTVALDKIECRSQCQCLADFIKLYVEKDPPNYLYTAQATPLEHRSYSGRVAIVRRQ